MNVVPGENGFQPLAEAEPSTDELPSEVRGAVSVLLDDGTVQTFAGTQTGIYQLNDVAGWDNVSEAEIIYDDALAAVTNGGSDVTIASNGYLVGSGEQWKSALYGTLLIDKRH